MNTIEKQVEARKKGIQEGEILLCGNKQYVVITVILDDIIIVEMEEDGSFDFFSKNKQTFNLSSLSNEWTIKEREEIPISKEEVIERIKDDACLSVMIEEIKNTNHEIIEKNGRLRWKEQKGFYEQIGNLNDVVMDFYEKGIDKNNEIWRDTYRKIGYSLYGYWEIFYWDVNNEEAEDYDYKKSFGNFSDI